MRVLVLGGDGFCGWPTSLHLSARGHDVAIVDNLSRRNIDVELEVGVADADPADRRAAAGVDGGHRPRDRVPPLRRRRDYDRLLTLLQEFRPDAIVHFAEQRAAPYSMKSPRHKRYTVDNNVNATHNLLAALVETGLDAHVVHLGHDGRLRLRHGRDRRSPRATCSVRIDAEDGADGRAGDPLPGQPGQRLPHDQDAGPAAVRVLQQERRAADHRPAPGHRVGHADRRDARATSG